MIRSEFPSLSPAQVTKALDQQYQVPAAGGLDSGQATEPRTLRPRCGPPPRWPSRTATGPGAGVVPRTAPVTPAVHAAKPSLMPKLRRYGVISLALLLILLLPIAVFALIRRRRERAEETESGWPDEPVTTQFAITGASVAEQPEFLPSPPACRPPPAAALEDAPGPRPALARHPGGPVRRPG